MSTACYRVVLTGQTLRGKTGLDIAMARGPLMGPDPALIAAFPANLLMARMGAAL